MDQTEKKERRRKTVGAARKISPMTGHHAGADASSEMGTGFPEMEQGLSPTLQAHIGRHLRAAFDEVAREPIPERLLRLLKDLERDGDK